MKKSKILLIPGLILLAIGFLSNQKYTSNFTVHEILAEPDTTQWIAPESADALINPIEVNEETLKDAKKVYRKHCRSCHGRLGDGNGSGAADLSTPATDFRNPEFLEQSDGSLFWKIGEGRNDMEPYKKKLYEEDIWLAVIFVKTFVPIEEE